MLLLILQLVLNTFVSISLFIIVIIVMGAVIIDVHMEYGKTLIAE
jgi:hypothetical protein